MSAITSEQEAAIQQYVNTHELSEGLGTKEAACSVAAINLALTGELTDNIPSCMSEVIGQWIIVIQDAIPSEIRNSKEWKSLLPLAAGTGRDQNKERERLTLIMNWMWEMVLPSVQPVADKHGFGTEWKTMTEEKTSAAAALAARAAALAARAADVAALASTAYAARAADVAATLAARAADVAARTALAADVAKAAYAAAKAVKAAARIINNAWATFNPCKVLAQLIAL